MSKSKKLTIIITLSVLVVATAGYFLLRHYNNRANSTSDTPDNSEVQQGVDESQNEQSQQGEKQKETPVTEDGKQQVSVVITHADINSVNAYVPEVLEDGGTCTATFTQGPTKITRTSKGIANVSYTQCAPIEPGLSTGGEWSVVVTYESDSSQGSSQSVTF